MNAVILVGGGGTRLRPLTYAIPKPLIPVLNQPLIARLIANLARHGVDNVVLAASASERRIENALGNGSSLGVKLSYSYETEPLGSGLAVKQAARGFEVAAGYAVGMLALRRVAVGICGLLRQVSSPWKLRKINNRVQRAFRSPGEVPPATGRVP